MASALRAMAALGVDVGVFQETKVTNGIYARSGSGYSVFATDANSAWQGGVALFWREHDLFVVEEQQAWGPNVISWHMVTGRERFYCIGAYIPPTDLSALEYIDKAWKACPKHCKPMLMGDLNIDLEYPWNK